MVSHSYPAVVDGIDQPTAPRRSAGRLATMVAAVVAGIVVAASGPLLGWLWAALAPRVPIIKVESGFVYAEAEPEQAVAADGWFAILGTAAGVVFAVLAWVLLRRYRGVTILAGLALGSLVAGVIAVWLGHKIGMAQFVALRDAAAVGDHIDAPLGLRVTNQDPDRWWIPTPTGVVAVQALVTVFVYTCLAGFSSYAELRGPSPRPEAAWAYPPTPLPGQYPPTALPEQYAPTALPEQYAPPLNGQPTAPLPGDDQDRPDQFGPGWTGRSEGATGTART